MAQADHMRSRGRTGLPVVHTVQGYPPSRKETTEGVRWDVACGQHAGQHALQAQRNLAARSRTPAARRGEMLDWSCRFEPGTTAATTAATSFAAAGTNANKNLRAHVGKGSHTLGRNPQTFRHLPASVYTGRTREIEHTHNCRGSGGVSINPSPHRHSLSAQRAP